jgi:hypothetical protein
MRQAPRQKDTGLEYRAYVMSAIVFSVAYLESSINQIFSRSEDKGISKVNNQVRLSLGWLPEAKRKQMLALWNMDKFRRQAGLFDKYEAALNILSNQEFETGQQLYQDVKALCLLRNELLHYKAENYQVPINSNEKVDQQALEKKLSGKFGKYPFTYKEQRLFFPELCLHHGCARWAVLSSIRFVDEFCHATKLASRRPESEDLRTEWETTDNGIT